MIKRWLRALTWVLLGGLLSGCAVQSIRDTAEEQLRQGQYENAVRTLDTGLARYPDSPVLRAGAHTVREQAVARLLLAASNAQAAQKPEVAQEALKRAQAIDPANERAPAQLKDLERAQRRQETLASARQSLEKGQTERALRSLESALKESPRDAELLALQRQLELEAKRLDEANAIALAETRPVSLDFRDVNVKMLFEVLSRHTGINFVLDKDVRPDLRTTVFLQKSRVEDALDLILSTNQLAKKILDPKTVLIYPNTPDKARDYQDLMIRAFFLNSAEAKQTAALLKAMLRIREPYVDEKLNMLVVRETPETIRLAERLIALHDQTEPEVLLDVEVLEIKSTRLTELGIKFPDTFSLTPLAPAGGSSLTWSNAQDINSGRIGLGVPGINVNLRREVGDVNMLANPKIRARNKEKAKILIGDKLPVITTTTTSTGFASENVSYLDVGLKVEVEPNVYLDDEVAIKVGLEVSSLTGILRTSAGSQAYQVGTRTANTVLRLKDGETQLLAGLISHEDRTAASRVPGAGDIPILGRLFSSQRDDGQRTEIVLSITPRIVRNIRRPDVNQAEFWSGTENNIRLRPLLPMPRQTAAQPAADTPAASTAPSATAAIAEPTEASTGTTEGIAFAFKGPTQVNAGQSFDLTVSIDTGVALRGLPLQIAYPAQRLELVEALEGDFFKQGNAQVSFSRNIVASEGRAMIGALRNTPEGAKGKGQLVTLRFKALNAGLAEVQILSATPIASGASPGAASLPQPHTLSVIAP